MFVRLKDMKNSTEQNINTAHIVSFEPANDGSNSKIWLVDGRTFIVEQSNRTLRHHCKKAPADQAIAD
jgi:hypothetical protein